VSVYFFACRFNSRCRNRLAQTISVCHRAQIAARNPCSRM
jgi:hypothetical protein